MIRRPPRSTRVRSSAASDVYKRQPSPPERLVLPQLARACPTTGRSRRCLSLIHISEPTRLLSNLVCRLLLEKKKKHQKEVKKRTKNRIYRKNQTKIKKRE